MEDLEKSIDYVSDDLIHSNSWQVYLSSNSQRFTCYASLEPLFTDKINFPVRNLAFEKHFYIDCNMWLRGYG